MSTALSPELLDKMDAYWRAANYLSVGQIYLLDNPLLKRPLAGEHVKPRLLGHWGTTPGQNFVYVHLNRIIREHDLSMIYISGPGDGEAETGPLARSWHGNKFLNPVHDGAVLPILHLNGYKIANPTLLARISREELESLMRGYGYAPRFVEGDEPATMHRLMAETLDEVIADIGAIQSDARTRGFKQRPCWPMIVLRTPKGWTGPKRVDGQQVEGTYPAHQVPLSDPVNHPRHRRMLESWRR